MKKINSILAKPHTPWAFKKQIITSKGESEQESLLLWAFLTRNSELEHERNGKRKDETGRRIFCLPHFLKRLLTLKNDMQHQSCVFCMPPPPLQQTLKEPPIILLLLIVMDIVITENDVKKTYPFWKALVGT